VTQASAFFPCRIDVASMRGAQTRAKWMFASAKHTRPREMYWRYGERRSFRPAMAFHSISRTCSSGVEPVKILGSFAARRRCVDHLFRGAILPPWS